jgi:seryl-tRNA synthetase
MNKVLGMIWAATLITGSLHAARTEKENIAQIEGDIAKWKEIEKQALMKKEHLEKMLQEEMDKTKERKDKLSKEIEDIEDKFEDEKIGLVNDIKKVTEQIANAQSKLSYYQEQLAHFTSVLGPVIQEQRPLDLVPYNTMSR